jgi:hypothetical protein
MCFISENLLLPQRKKRKYYKTLVWTHQNIKPFLKQILKKKSQKLKFDSVPHNDKDIEFDNTKKQIWKG